MSNIIASETPSKLELTLLTKSAVCTLGTNFLISNLATVSNCLRYRVQTQAATEPCHKICVNILRLRTRAAQRYPNLPIEPEQINMALKLQRQISKLAQIPNHFAEILRNMLPKLTLLEKYAATTCTLENTPSQTIQRLLCQTAFLKENKLKLPPNLVIKSA